MREIADTALFPSQLKLFSVKGTFEAAVRRAEEFLLDEFLRHSSLTFFLNHFRGNNVGAIMPAGIINCLKGYKP